MFTNAKQMNRYVNGKDFQPIIPTFDFEDINICEAEYFNLISLATARTKEEYLDWVSAWKKMEKHLVNYTKTLKRNRNNHEFIRMIGGRGNEPYSAIMDSNIAYAQHIARMMYEVRRNMKLVSFVQSEQNVRIQVSKAA